MSHTNKYLASHDEERRLARRGELKRTLAELAVKRDRVAELQRVVAALDADSDTKADEHSAAAERLQTELAGLDAAHVDTLLAGGKPNAEVTTRRAEILAELARLNATLELHCESNKRAAAPIRKEIEQLRAEVGAGQIVENHLRDLASPAVRQKQIYAELLSKAAAMMASRAGRAVAIFEQNVGICELNGDSQGKAINEAKLADWQAVALMVGNEAGRAHTMSREALREGLAE